MHWYPALKFRLNGILKYAIIKPNYIERHSNYNYESNTFIHDYDKK